MSTNPANEALIVQLLDWIGEEPRPYTDAQAAWRTSCPRLDIWETALDRGLIERLPGPSLAEAKVAVSAKGRAVLKARV